MAGSAVTGVVEHASCNCCGARALRWAKRTKNFPAAWWGATKAPGFSVGPTATLLREWIGPKSCFSPILEKQSKPACAPAKFAGRLKRFEAKKICWAPCAVDFLDIVN